MIKVHYQLFVLALFFLSFSCVYKPIPNTPSNKTLESHLDDIAQQLINDADYVAKWEEEEDWGAFIRKLYNEIPQNIGDVATIEIAKKNSNPSKKQVNQLAFLFGKKGFMFINIVKDISFLQRIALGIRIHTLNE